MAVDSMELLAILAESSNLARQAGEPESTANLLLAITSVEPSRAQLFLVQKQVTSERVMMNLPSCPKRDPEGLVKKAVDDARRVAAECACQETDSIHLLVALARNPKCEAACLLETCGIDRARLAARALSYYVPGAPKPRCWKKLSESSCLWQSQNTEDGRTCSASSQPDVPGAQPSETRHSSAGARQGLLPIAPLSCAPLPVRLSRMPRSSGTPDAAQRMRPSRISSVSVVEDGNGGEGGSKKAPAPGERSPSFQISIEQPSDVPSQLPPPMVPDRASGSRFALDPAVTPTLCQLGRNLTLMAAEGRLDPVIGRQREIDEVVDILGKRRSNNPCLVGEPGVGKTAVVEGVAQAMYSLAESGVGAGDRILVELDMAGMLSGTQLRGAFSERMNAVKEEVRQAAGRIVVFIDEIHTIVGAGATDDGPQDAANELKGALARGDFPCIGATTFDEYRKYIQKDPALERRFSIVQVNEPSQEEAVAILEGVAKSYEAHHGVTYSHEALQAAASLAGRFIPDRCLPDKAISVMDLAGSRTRREGGKVVGLKEIAGTVSRICGVPEERLVQGESKRILHLKKDLGRRVIGHEGIVDTVSRVLRRNYAGFSSHRPMGSFLFLGPTGVGKTELSKALGEALFGKRNSLVRLDMSECSDATGVARLIGAAPGYVGFGEGGALTDAVRRHPSSVVLFDEVEKAHRDVLMLLLQILEEGEVSDCRGRKVSFTNTVVILTSNLGAEAFRRRRGGIGFGDGDAGADAEPCQSELESQAAKAMETAKEAIAPELWNRLDEHLCFLPLSRIEVAQVAALLLDDSSKRLSRDQGITYGVTTQVIQHLLDNGGYAPDLGARPMRRTIQTLVEAPLADAILEGRFTRGDSVAAGLKDGAIVFKRFRKAAAQTPSP